MILKLCFTEPRMQQTAILQSFTQNDNLKCACTPPVTMGLFHNFPTTAVTQGKHSKDPRYIAPIDPWK